MEASNIKSNVSMWRDSARIIENTQNVSQIINTGLDEKTLAICIELCEQGINPEALAAVVKELKREAHAIESAKTY